MKLKKETLLELKQILKEEYKFDVTGKELEKFAINLVGYYDLLLKLNSKQKVRKSSA